VYRDASIQEKYLPTYLRTFMLTLVGSTSMVTFIVI